MVIVCIVHSGNGRGPSPLAVLSWTSLARRATEATPVQRTDWARGWEPACRTWSNLPTTPWLRALTLAERPLSGRWLPMSVSAAGGNGLKWIKSRTFSNFLYPLPGLKFPQRPVKVFRLPDFPPPLAYYYIQNYYSDMVASLGRAINTTPPEESALLARYCGERKIF